MIYLTKTTEISSTIAKLTTAKALWLDTEVADWQTHHPRLSLIQVLGDPKDLTGDRVYILDVLDKPDLVADFINQIMANPNITKIFHNASYDLRFLGREQAKNVICTYKLAQKISKDVLQVTDLKLKTLAAQLCNFNNIDKEEQGSDWGKRSLTPKQLHYATMDVVYLAQVHRRLIELFSNSNSTPKSNISQTKNLSFSATKVRVGFECSRLFYLDHHFGGETLFLPNHTCNGIGNIFHKLAAQFVSLAQQ
jgi:S-DNA-T family DNA segregation ATPase FtsK/SpoIIIE